MQKTFDWGSQKIIVTGGAGFLGSHLVTHLKSLGAGQVIVPRSQDYDLREKEAVVQLYEDNPGTTLVIHLAAVVGGIGANREHPGVFFYDNLMMGTLLLEYARRAAVPKFVGVGTICSYPKYTPIPFKEDDLWNGYPEETNAPYGLAKKMLLVQSQAYRQEFGYNAIHLLPVNLYGPGDNFDPKTAHVIPDMIRKMLEAKEANVPYVTLFGDGTPTREFLYVKDAAEGIALATAYYDDPEPVNIGSAFEISIKDLAETIARVVGFEGELLWDTSKPNGQPRRKLDVSRAEEAFGFRSHVTFSDGLRETVDWYLGQRIVSGS
ncbi:MAG: GDP-L-fucose synthase [Anaerolineaceae bacterium]|nr:GDP-L-fucose synthase [Anaerolineaceae bacterium]